MVRTRLVWRSGDATREPEWGPVDSEVCRVGVERVGVAGRALQKAALREVCCEAMYLGSLQQEGPRPPRMWVSWPAVEQQGRALYQGPHVLLQATSRGS